jgi:hypothetical protein
MHYPPPPAPSKVRWITPMLAETRRLVRSVAVVWQDWTGLQQENG